MCKIGANNIFSSLLGRHEYMLAFHLGGNELTFDQFEPIINQLFANYLLLPITTHKMSNYTRF